MFSKTISKFLSGTSFAGRILGLVLLVQTGASAAPAYDATYEMITAEGPAYQRKVSDGNGRVRTEIRSTRGLAVMIEDQVNHVKYKLVPERKLVVQSYLSKKSKSKGQGLMMLSDEEARMMGLQPLGSRLIEGHPCHGWRVSTAMAQGDMWIGDDIGIPVRSDMYSQMTGKMTVSLKTYSPSRPDPALFEVPADYQVLGMPAGIAGGILPPAAARMRFRGPQGASFVPPFAGQFPGSVMPPSAPQDLISE